MSKPIGGRGHKAPYTTTHVRVPEPIKAEVERVIEDFRSGQAGRYLRREELVELCQSVLTQKKSAKKTLENLLTALFDDSITL